MIEYTARQLCTGSMLRNYINETVSIHVNVQPEVERGATVIKGIATDDLEVTINLSQPLNAPLKGWIEVIGIPTDATTIRNKEIILFPDDQGQEPYNKSAHVQMVTFWANCKDVFKTE